MARHLRLEVPYSADGHRRAVGVLVSSKCTQVAAAAVAATGGGLDCRIDIAGAATAKVPRETASLFAAVQGKGPFRAGTLTALRSQLAEIQVSLLGELLASSGIAPAGVLAVGVHDPGLWRFDGSGRAYLGLCNAAEVAEATGLNVIDSFPARDLTQGGQGGPITALPEWLLLKDPLQGRVLLDLGRTTRMTYLPPSSAENAHSRILCFDVGPGTALLDRLAVRLTGGEHRFDPGGRLAVQGRRIPELIGHWLENPYFERPLPRWHPHEVRPERFLTEAVQMAVEADWSIRDLLCSGTHFIAESIAAAMRRRLPDDARIDEILITGGGQHNGLLLREIGRLTELPLVGIESPDMPADALGPSCIATLALLYLDQVPANPTAITGATVPRMLGRLTPGSPQSWQRLLSAVSGSTPAVRPLRSAV